MLLNNKKISVMMNYDKNSQRYGGKTIQLMLSSKNIEWEKDTVCLSGRFSFFGIAKSL